MAEENKRQRVLDRLKDRAIKAESLRVAGQYAEAERLQRQVLRETVQIQGLEDRATLMAKG